MSIETLSPVAHVYDAMGDRPGCEAAHHPALATSAEQVDLNELATQIADEAARGLVEGVCVPVASGDKLWYDLRSCRLDDWAHVDRAMTYLARRGGALEDFTVVHCAAFPNLVRFEDRA